MTCFDFNVVTQPDGDVKSNLLMRVLESFESIKIIRQAVANMPEGKVVNRDWEMFDTDLIEKSINDEILTAPLKVYKATTGNYSGMIGAALLALEAV